MSRAAWFFPSCLGTTIILLVVALIAASRGVATTPEPLRYQTVSGLELDKWASAWLISRHVAPGASIEVVNDTELLTLPPKFRFDAPGAIYQRTPISLVFEKLLNNLPDPAPAWTQLGEILFGLEQIAWTSAFYQDASAIEATYRELQQAFRPNDVPVACYLAYFDTVVEGLEKDALGEIRQWMDSVQSGHHECTSLTAPNTTHSSSDTIGETTIEDLLARIADGDRVIFIDTREPREYAEGHIPTAINLSLRDINDTSLAALSNADVIVPYCVKDFRGYEVARRLNALGLDGVTLMNPYGLSGWRHLGLPITVGSKGNDPPLDTVARDRTRCILDGGKGVSCG